MKYNINKIIENTPHIIMLERVIRNLIVEASTYASILEFMNGKDCATPELVAFLKSSHKENYKKIATYKKLIEHDGGLISDSDLDDEIQSITYDLLKAKTINNDTLNKLNKLNQLKGSRS